MDDLNETEHARQVRARQKTRARVTALLLVGFALLLFLITIAKIKASMA